ncbi:sulfatase [Achromobacter denitrificans]|uniref:Sulfatase n=2 Tax=Achromobacter TaxID=222 RepID=A0A3R9GU49_ACHDE|nr:MULTISPECIES: sulfatase [Achromobacter]MBV2157674.1 sulfatase [Achromobacter denitrificans]MCW0208108.1 sulfatase [Achromobacter sp.]MDF3858464.1 sulfatase [Achromobacter denitrificans]MDF3944445.1 sulfatase [Achromobacter denitrificans]MDX3882259.1 sulfatase [Achromobacter sp.]
MNTVTKKPSETFVKEYKLISKPGAVIKVRELTLTEFGMRAITSGSAGIRQGALEEAGPPSPFKKMAPA